MNICARCGHENPQSLTFCEQCDAFLEWNTARATPTPSPAPASTPPSGAGDHAGPVPPPAAHRRPSSPPTSGRRPASGPTARPTAGPDRGAARAAAPAGTSPSTTGSLPGRRGASAASSPAGGGAEPPGREGTSRRTGGRSAADEAAADLVTCLAKARAHDRADLVELLVAAQQGLVDRELSVVVAGEYKQGKSSLVNAMVKTEVCPVDDDIVTAVPTIVRYGTQAQACIHLDPRQVAAVDVLAADEFVQSMPAAEGAAAPGASPPREASRATEPPPPGGEAGSGLLDGAGEGDAPGGGHAVAISLEDVPRYIRGEVDHSREGADLGRLRSVEVRLPRQVLKAGLSFVDSPGVGGLESAEGSIVLGVLDMAEALIFVTDASQELTRAEVSFLQAAVARCPKVACVVTKTDLHADWRRMVELDREHLRRGGLGHIPVMGVTSFLRMRAAATNDAAMNDESGFPALFEFLRSRVVTEGRAAQVAHANAQVAFAVRELERGLRAESAVIARPEQADHVVQRLADASRASAALQSGNAPWQQLLNDGIQDLVANVDHDLRNRLKAVVRSGEDIIARTDPASSWSEFEAWLRRQVVTAAVETYDYMATLTAELTERVGRQFQRDSDDPIALSISAPVAALERVQLGGEFSDRKGLRSSVLLSAARGSYGGMLMFGMAGTLLSITVATPIMLLLSIGLGRRSVREELKRHHQQNQAQARAALQRYAGEVGLLVDKECKDALRRTQRQLRDEFTARARSLHQSATDALATAQRARRLDPDQQAVRQAAAAREIDELGALAQAAPATRVPAPVGGRR